MLINTHNHSDFPDQKMQKCRDYIQALEVERSKIQVFQRELPLCFELVTQAIEACKQQLSGTTMESNLQGQSECNSEQTSSDVPVFEEFMPIKRASSHSDGEEQESKKFKNDNISDKLDAKDNGNTDKNSKKSDWLRSVQLWNQTPDPPLKEDHSPRKVAVKEVTRNGSGGAFHPFKKDKTGGGGAAAPPPAPAPASTSSTAGTGGSSGGGNKKEEKEGQSQRKARRCWSPELHKRFLQALQQLGGSHVATPKQIRELMKVDGLTNDEVKSHLQKYRLHTRRPTPSMPNNNSNPQQPQFVVVGGIWVPPEYAAMTTTATSGEASGVAPTSNGIYTPIASLPPPFQETSKTSPKQRQHKSSHSDDGGSHSNGGAQSHSPATSSTHTTTASPAY